MPRKKKTKIIPVVDLYQEHIDYMAKRISGLQASAEMQDALYEGLEDNYQLLANKLRQVQTTRFILWCAVAALVGANIIAHA